MKNLFFPLVTAIVLFGGFIGYVYLTSKKGLEAESKVVTEAEARDSTITPPFLIPDTLIKVEPNPACGISDGIHTAYAQKFVLSTQTGWKGRLDVEIRNCTVVKILDGEEWLDYRDFQETVLNRGYATIQTNDRVIFTVAFY